MSTRLQNPGGGIVGDGLRIAQFNSFLLAKRLMFQAPPPVDAPVAPEGDKARLLHFSIHEERDEQPRDVWGLFVHSLPLYGARSVFVVSGVAFQSPEPYSPQALGV
jgi:hypothetical protein